jgi:hypothetical protein
MDMALSALNTSLEDIQKKGERVERGYEKQYEQYKNLIKIIQEDFKHLINEVSKKRAEKPVIIFFDDLDRCLPDKTIQLLEAVKNLFVVPDSKVIFICGIDTHIAKQFIKSHYKDIEDAFAINYFRKIFNLTISMPHSPDVKKLLVKHIQELFDWEEQEAEGLADTVYSSAVQAEMSSVRKQLNVLNNFYVFQKFNPKRFKVTESSLSSLKIDGISSEIIAKLKGLKDEEEKTEKEFVEVLQETLDGEQFKNCPAILKHIHPDNVVIYLLIVKEAWQPLYELIVKQALRERTKNLGVLIHDVLKNCTTEDYLLTEVEKSFFKYYFIREESPFCNVNLVDDFLYKYPTLT